MIKLLVVARHGEYCMSGSLTPAGQRSVYQLAGRLREQIKDGKVRILTSKTTRTKESAAIIADIFGTTREEFDVLISDQCHDPDVATVTELIKKIEADDPEVSTLILMTHYEYTEELPAFYGQQVLGTQFHQFPVPKGRAWLIDCQKRTCTRI